MSTSIQRVAFSTNRASEFATEKELEKQVGGSRQLLTAATLGELTSTSAITTARLIQAKAHVRIDSMRRVGVRIFQQRYLRKYRRLIQYERFRI